MLGTITIVYYIVGIRGQIANSSMSSITIPNAHIMIHSHHVTIPLSQSANYYHMAMPGQYMVTVDAEGRKQ